MLSPDEVKRLMRYCILHFSPVISSRPNVPLTGHDSSPTHPPCRSDDRRGPSARASLALQALYANDSVKHPLADITPLAKYLDDSDDHGNGHEDDDDDDDNDSDWEEDMDLVTYARYYAATTSFLAKMTSRCVNSLINV